MSIKLFRDSGPYFATLVLLLAGAVGACVVLIPLEASLLLVVTLAASAVMLLARAALRPQFLADEVVARSVDPAREEARSTEGISNAALELPRWLFYAGTLTIAQLTVRPMLGLNLSDWFYFASIALAVLILMTHRSLVTFRLPALLISGTVIYAIGGLASSFGAGLEVQSVAVVVRLLYLTLVWFWLSTLLLRRPEHIQIAMLCWVLSAAITGAAAVAQFLLGDIIPNTSPTWGRMTGFTPHHNELGAITAVAFVPSLGLALTLGGWPRALVVFSVALILLGELLSGSLSALAAASVGAVLWLATSDLSLRKLVAFLTVAGVVVAIALLAFEGTGAKLPFERVDEVTSRQDEGATFWTRVSTYEDALESINGNPLIGVGLDEVSQERKTEFPVHNILLGPWFTAGLLGVIGIGTVLISLILVAGQVVIKAEKGSDYLLSLALFAAFIVFVIYALTAPALYTRYGWVPVALLLARRRMLFRLER